MYVSFDYIKKIERDFIKNWREIITMIKEKKKEEGKILLIYNF